MGFFSSIFRGRDAPTDRTSGSAYSFFMGGSTSGKRVNERTAMQMTAVYSCVRILSEAVAGLPLQFYRYTKDGGKEKAVDHPLYFLLHDEPNPEMTSFVFRETLMTHLLLWGNAYSQIIRNARGEIIALYPLMPDRMTVNRDGDGQLYYEYNMSTDDAHTLKGSTVRLQPHDVLHIPGLGFDGLVGYSPIAMAKNAIGMAIACEEYGAKFFANGAAPSGVLEHPGTIKDPSRVRESWQSTFGGSANANKVAVLEEGMKYTPISISPNEAQFLETRKFQIDEIARIFRVPPHMVGDLEKGKPLGILAAAGGAEVGVTAASATAITADEVIDLFYSLKAPYRKNAVWVLNDATVKQIRKLKDTTGQYLWQPSLVAGTPDTILGRPVKTSAFMPTAAAGAKTIAFGDFKYYWIADRQGRTFKKLSELYAANGQVGFMGTQRVDGKLILPEAIKVLQQKSGSSS